MQVSGINEADVAVVSTNPAQEFMIANTPDFFNILSGSLYSNPILAICRETICNAWDANEANGKGNEPVVVNLLGGELLVQDEGPGIPDEKIVEIYGTYGLSTKTNQSNLTGGFGLGCKSPFAYCDNFEVTSVCNGIRTVYQMTRASEQTAGKPAINKLFSTPTNDKSGLAVKLTVKEDDEEAFLTAISKVCGCSEKPTMFNGRLINHLPKFKNFIFTSNLNLPFRLDFYIYIKYGEVLYPLRSTADYSYADIYEKLNEFVHNFSYGCSNKTALVIKAPANSLTVVPSREELRYTDANQKVLKKLLNKTHETLFSNLKEKCKSAIEEWCEARKVRYLLADEEWENIGHDALYFHGAEQYYTEDTVHTKFYHFFKLDQIDLFFREYCLKDSPFKNSALKAYKKEMNLSEKNQHPIKWFKKHFLKELDKKLASKNLSLSKLSFKMPPYAGISTYTGDSSFKNLKWKQAFHFMIPTVYVGTRVSKTTVDGAYVPRYHLFYKCTQKTLEATKQALVELGFKVIQVAAVQNPTEETVKKNTVLHINSLQQYASRHYIWDCDVVSEYREYTLQMLEEGGYFIDRAKAVFVWNNKTQNSGVDSRMLSRLSKVMGSDVVIAQTQRDMKILQKRFNLVPLKDYLIEKTKEYFSKRLKWSPSEDAFVYSFDIDERDAVRNFCKLVKQENHDFGYKFLSTTGTSGWYRLYNDLNESLKLDIKPNVYVDKTYLKFKKDWTQNYLRFCPDARTPGLFMFVRKVLLKRNH